MEDFDVDSLKEEYDDYVPVTKETPAQNKKANTTRKKVNRTDELISCLRNEKVRVEYILKPDSKAKDKNHPWYGGFADGATMSLVLPTLRDGITYVDPLTTAEKNFLEAYMGLEPNALSIYNKEDNFWDNKQVILDKGGLVLDLSRPNDYIAYAILRANKDIIAPSPKAYRDKPLATYRFMLVSDSQKASDSREQNNIRSSAWRAYLAIEDNFDALRVVVESLEGKNIDTKSDIEFLKERAQELLEQNPKVFVKIAADPLIPAKILLKKAVDAKVVSRNGNYYYYNGQPLCEKNADPTFSIAAAYIAEPKNTELKFSIEAKLN